MAGFGGFLRGLGLQAGENMLYGQQYEQQQAKTQLLQADAQKDKLQAQQMQQQMKTQKDLGAFIQAQIALDGADAATPAGLAKLYSKSAGFAASQGDFASAQEMTKLAEQSTNEARDQAVQLAQQQATKNEDLANSADAYSSSPTRDGAMDLVRKAIAAGVNPATIPANLNSPEGQAWVKQRQLAGMTSAQRAEFVQKTADLKAKRDEDWQKHEDDVGLRRAQIQATAAYREDMIALRKSEEESRKVDRAERAARPPQMVKFDDGNYEFDPDGTVKGKRNDHDPRYVKISELPLTAQQRGGVARLNEAVGEGARALTRMSSFDVDTRSSPFAHLGAHTPFDALVKVGAQALTPDQIQMMGVSGANLGNQIGSAEAAFGGRMPNGTQQDHIERAVTPGGGDSGLTAAYKLANGKEIFETVLKYAPPSYRNSDDAKAHMAELAKINWTTDDVIKAARKAADGGKSVKTLGDLGAATSAIRRDIASNMASSSGGEALPGGSDQGAGTNVPLIPAAGGKDYSHLWN